MLGSGWGPAADLLGRTEAQVAAADLPGFSAPAVAGHGGFVRSVAIGDTGRRALVLPRTHFYEGKGVRAVVHGVRTAAAAGCSVIVFTNGCGGLDRSWAPGTPVLITRPPQPDRRLADRGRELRRPDRPLLAPAARAVPATSSPTWPRASTRSSAGRSTRRRPRCGWPASSARNLVGMSTAIEAIAARQAGLEMLGLSLVTNLAAGISDRPLDHAEVLEAGRAAAERCGRMLAQVVRRL